MENSFRNSLLNFLQSINVQFIENKNVFCFTELDLTIVLQYASKSALQTAPQSFKDYLPSKDILYLYEDRWWHSQELVQWRIMSRLGHFKSVFARKCKIVGGKQVQEAVQDFLEKYHSYGKAKSKYRYALLYENDIVAVASFSQPRSIPRNINGEIILFQSYEWIRYASLPNVRVVGGMGRLLQAFMKELKELKQAYPIEVMSYSDNEWSSGSVYEKLGFSPAGEREAVEYFVNRATYERLSERKLLKYYYNEIFRSESSHIAGKQKKIESAAMLPQSFLNNFYKIKNKGSRKFLIREEPLLPRSVLCSSGE